MLYLCFLPRATDVASCMVLNVTLLLDPPPTATDMPSLHHLQIRYSPKTFPAHKFDDNSYQLVNIAVDHC